MIDGNARTLAGLTALIVCVAGVVHALQWWSGEQSGSQVVSLAKPGDIHMVSSVTCVYCDRARAWFTENRVPFTECFIERDVTCDSLFRSLMAPGTPVLLVKGRRLIGFDANAVAGALKE